MDKRRIEINVSRTHWSDESIDKLIKELEEAKKKGATNVCINDAEGADVDTYYYRPETDEEFEKRKLKVKKSQEIIKKRELEQLAKLKAKYE